MELLMELQENLRMYRAKKGFDTYFDNNEELLNQLFDYLHILEEGMILDPDLISLLDKDYESLSKSQQAVVDLCEIKRYNKYGTPYKNSPSNHYHKYLKEQELLEKGLLQDMASFLKKADNFPTKRGKIFKGFTMHFSTSDPLLIRSYLMDVQQYQDFVDWEKDDIHYTL